jgi:hypothetical protein
MIEHYTKHPKHHLPEEVRSALDSDYQQQLDIAARQVEFIKLTRPSDEERAHREILLETIGRSLGVDVADYRSKSSQFKENQLKRVQATDFPAFESYVDLVDVDFEADEPTDSSFWWAEQTVRVDPPYSSEVKTDGIHFRGEKNYDGSSLLKLSFGVTARYGIGPERWPPSPSGRWQSVPHANLFGRLLGFTNACDIFCGDFWSKCWLIKRQTLVQHLVGGTKKVGGGV